MVFRSPEKNWEVVFCARSSKELSAPLTTKRKIYELADWQNITTDIQITAPSGS